MVAVAGWFRYDSIGSGRTAIFWAPQRLPSLGGFWLVP